jgi:hypothetical protein
VSARTCPEGHQTSAEDWCDVCGAPMDAAAPNGTSPPPPPSPGSDPAPAPPAAAATPAAATTRACPSCDAVAPADALFCEVCGYDFTTGELPPEPDPAPADSLSIEITPTPPPTPAGPAAFVAEVWVDPDWYAAQESDDPCPSAGAPVVVPLHERSLLVGRTSASRGIHPQIDCASDTGVSRRHAQLTTDGQRWWVEDLQSANGTYVGSAGAELPSDPMAAGQRQELADDDRIYLGAWTRIVVRAATADEQAP